MIKVGDVVEYVAGLKAVVEKIKIISTGEFVGESRYGDIGYDILLVLRDSRGAFKLCFEKRPTVICGSKRS